MNLIGMTAADMEVFGRFVQSLGLEREQAASFLDATVLRSDKHEEDIDLLETLERLNRKTLKEIGRHELKTLGTFPPATSGFSVSGFRRILSRLLSNDTTRTEARQRSRLLLENLLVRYCSTGVDALVIAGLHGIARLSRLDGTQARCVAYRLGEPLSEVFLHCWHAYNAAEESEDSAR